MQSVPVEHVSARSICILKLGLSDQICSYGNLRYEVPAVETPLMSAGLLQMRQLKV